MADDSDDSSNIGNLLKEAQRRCTKATPVDDYDDDSSSEEEGTSTPRFSSGRKRGAGSSLKQRVSALRKVRPSPTSKLAPMDSDDDDEDAAASQSNAEAAKLPSIRLELEDSSDEEVPRGHTSSIYELSQNGANKESIERLQIMRLARVKLQRSQASNIHDIERDATYRGDMLRMQEVQAAKFMTLIVNPRFDENSSSSKISLPESLRVVMSSDHTAEDLLLKFMNEAKLDDKACTVAMKYDGKLLDKRRQLSKYSLREGSKIDAIVYLSTICTSSAHGTSASAGLDLGRLIPLKLRNKQGKVDVLKMHMKENFQVLVDKYMSLKNLPSSSKLVLRFECDKMGLGQTPQMLDMDDDDLIDVDVL
jgi:hypothetical protein